MAVTVEGVFRILDRASGPMARMERQAKQTDRAIARLGMTTDNVGTSGQQRQIRDTERVMRDFGNESERTGRKLRVVEGDVQRVERRARSLKAAVTETGAAIRGMGAIFGLIKFPAIAVGIGVLVQAVGALSGGVIGLLPRLVDLSGAFAALGPTLVGIGGAMVTVKLATHDLSKAYGGNQKALQSLTPTARSFLTHLKEYAPVMKQIREAAQGGLFGGLDYALMRVQRGLPAATSLLRQFSRTLGGLAANAAQRFTTPGFLQDLLGIGAAGNRAVNRGGRAIIDVIDSLRQLSSAAIPFTDWITRVIERTGKWIDQWSIFARDSGRFQKFLDRSRTSLTQFGHILQNVWGWFSALGRAARPLGEMLWRDVERATASWSKYANSVEGQIHLTQQFTAMYPAIHAMVTLVDNLARTIFRMGSSPALPGVVNSLNTLLPSLERIFTLLANSFGPLLAETLVQIADTLTILVGASGPLTIFLTLLNTALRVINGLAAAIPGFGRAMGTALAVVGIAVFIGRVERLARGWWAVATGARAAATAEAAATSGAVGLGAAGAGAGVAGGVAAGRWVAGPGGAMVWEAGAAGAAAGGAARLGLRGGLRAAGGRLGAAAGRFALPVTAALGAYGALTTRTDPGLLTGGIERLYGGLHAATAGLVPAWATGANRNDRAVNAVLQGGRVTVGGHYDFSPFHGLLQPANKIYGGRELVGMNLNDRLARLGGADPHTLGQVTGQLRVMQQAVAQLRTINSDSARTTIAGLNAEIRARRSVLKTIQDQRNEQSRALAYRLVRQEGQAFDIYAGKYGQAGAATRTNADVLGRLKGMEGPGRRILAQNYLSWLYEEQKGNKALAGPYQDMERSVYALYDRLGRKVKIVNGQIYDGTAQSWKQIRDAMGSAAEQAAERVSSAFTRIQQKAVAVLTAMGFTPGKAAALVQATEMGGRAAAAANEIVTRTANRQPGPVQGENLIPRGKKTRAHGGRIVGTNTHDRGDRYAFGGNLVGSGELVVNRHTERKVNHLLAGRSTLGNLVASEGTPHSFATGGRATGLQAGIARAGQSVLSHVPGLVVTSTTGGKHAPNSYHYLGEAEDIAGSAGAMAAGVRYILSSGLWRILAEGIHNPGLSIKNGRQVSPGFWGASTWAGHANHIHLAVIGGGGRFSAGGPGGAGGLGSVTAAQLSPGRSGLPGLPGVLADQAGGLMAAGMASGLNSIPWYGDGANFRARRPMVIGVGDRDEHVQITPTHKMSRGGRPIQLVVHIGTIENHRAGDIVAIVHDEFEKLAAQLDAEDGGDGVIA